MKKNETLIRVYEGSIKLAGMDRQIFLTLKVENNKNFHLALTKEGGDNYFAIYGDDLNSIQNVATELQSIITAAKMDIDKAAPTPDGGTG